MRYTLPSDEALVREHNDAFDAAWKENTEPPLRVAHRAVARLAIDHYIAECVKASGVDVETLAEVCAASFLPVEWYEDDHSSRDARCCRTVNHISDALRTAIAQAVAQERERIARWLEVDSPSMSMDAAAKLREEPKR